MSRAPMRVNYRAGVIASLTAEAVFTATMMGLLHLRGKDLWNVTRASASLVFGPEVARPPGFVPGDAWGLRDGFDDLRTVHSQNRAGESVGASRHPPTMDEPFGSDSCAVIAAMLA